MVKAWPAQHRSTQSWRACASARGRAVRCSLLVVFQQCAQWLKTTRRAIFLRELVCQYASRFAKSYATGPVATRRHVAVGLLPLRSAKLEKCGAVRAAPLAATARARLVRDKVGCGSVAHYLPLPTICCPTPGRRALQSKPI